MKYMVLSSTSALIFLIAVLPIGLYVAYSDLARMKIPNMATDALALAYVVLGPFALPFDLYLWGFASFAVMLLVGILLNTAGVMGAGDSKFIASAAPFIAVADAPMILGLLAGCLLAGWAVHRIARHSPLRAQVPNWASWEQGKRFPMGFPLAGTLILYLMIAADFF